MGTKGGFSDITSLQKVTILENENEEIGCYGKHGIYNGTQHDINIFSLIQTDITNPRKLILLEGEKPSYIVPAGSNLNCVKGNKPAPQGNFPFAVKGAATFEAVDPLPKGYDVYIVSNLYRAAALELGQDTSKLAVVDGVVYDSIDNPRPCGCLGLAIG